MKRTKLGIVLLLMIALVATSGTFAYWASGLGAGTADYASATVTIGEGTTESSSVSFGTVSNTGSALVPTSNAATAGVEDTATWTIPVQWAQDSGTEFAGDAGTLAVTVTYAMSNSTLTSAQLDAMFSFSVTGDGAITEGAAAQNVVVTVVFDTEPTNEATYLDVINETLTVTITFTATAS